MESHLQGCSVIGDSTRLEDVHSIGCNGKLLQNESEAWLCSKDCVYIIDVNSGVTVQKWKCNYGEIYYSTDVTCFNSPHIVVAAKFTSQDSVTVLTLLKVSSLRVVKSVFLPDEIACVSSVAIGMESCDTSNCLAYFDGILGVGLYGGKVYLLDVKVSLSGTDEPVTLTIFDHQTIPETFHGKHSALLLFQDYIQDQQFVYQKYSFPLHEVYVSAIHYVHQLSSLFVGFSIGCFVVYNVKDAIITYTSPCSLHRASPIIDFVYMEPENDPKCFVYVWVARGNAMNSKLARCETKLTLYQMLLTKQQGSCEFQSFAPRMEYALTNCPSASNPQNSLASSFFGSSATKSFRTVCGSEEVYYEEDCSVAAFIWSTGMNSQYQYFVATFDINQWYQAQMPNVVKWKMPTEKYNGILGCSYFAFFSLDEVISQAEEVLDIHVKNLSYFPSHCPVPPSHVWPSSMKFCVSVLKRDAISHCVFLGVPRSALREVASHSLSQTDEVIDLLGKAEFLDLHCSNIQKLDILKILIEHDVSAKTVSAKIEEFMSESDCSSLVHFLWDEANKLDILSVSSGSLLAVQKLGTLQRFVDGIYICLNKNALGVSEDVIKLKEILLKKKKIADVIFFWNSRTLSDVVSLGVSDYKSRSVSEIYVKLNWPFFSGKSAMQHLCDEFGPISVHYPPTSRSNLMKVFQANNIKFINSYVS